MVYCTIMYITKYGCVFLKLGESTIDNRDYVVSIIYESTYVAMDLICAQRGNGSHLRANVA